MSRSTLVMNSREFFSKSLLECHKLVVEQFLIVQCEDEEHKIDIETADHLAENAYRLAMRLTVQWELRMRIRQADDDRLSYEQERELTTTDLCQPFTQAPGICPDCGCFAHDDDDDDDHIPANSYLN
jgi:hypothetical protein